MNRARFGVFEAGLQDGSLRKRGQRLRLQEKPFQALALLLENAGEIVTREQFRGRLWPAGTFVEFDDNLNAAIKRLREAIGDSAENPRFIETVPRRGYRFIAPIEQIEDIPTVAPASARGHWASAMFLVALLALSVTASSQHVAAPGRTYRVVVLPFLNVGSSERQFFADGVTAEVSSQLRRLYPQRIVVIKSAGTGPLAADYLIRGSVRRQELDAELIRTNDHTRLWNATFRLPLQEVFVSGEVNQGVARSLRLRIPPPERTELSRAFTVDAEAYECYLRGLHESKDETATSLPAAIAWFEKALHADPQFAMPYAGLARSYLASGRLHLIAAAQAEKNAHDAIEHGATLDPAIADFHILRADIAAQQPGSHQEAEQAYQHAIQLDPNNVEAHEHYALYLRERRPMQALSEIDKARELDPQSPWLNACAGWILISAGRLDEATTQLHHALRLDPTSPHTMRFMANLEMRRGRMNEAITWFDKAADASGREPYFVYRLGLACANAGREARVRGLLDELRNEAAHRYVDPEFIRSLQGALGG